MFLLVILPTRTGMILPWLLIWMSTFDHKWGGWIVLDLYLGRNVFPFQFTWHSLEYHFFVYRWLSYIIVMSPQEHNQLLLWMRIHYSQTMDHTINEDSVDYKMGTLTVNETSFGLSAQYFETNPTSEGSSSQLYIKNSSRRPLNGFLSGKWPPILALLQSVDNLGPAWLWKLALRRPFT